MIRLASLNSCRALSALGRLSIGPRRGITIDSIEVPFDCAVLERPCAVYLLEDPFFYDNSWNDKLALSLPHKHGFHYFYGSLSLSTLSNALEELEDDVALIPSVVLLTRGPLVSWVAQYYLESLPLSGLVMVDPFLGPSAKTAQHLKKSYKDTPLLLDSIISGHESRSLKLEPGVIPMNVFTSINYSDHHILRDAVQETIAHHCDPDGVHGTFESQMLHDQTDIGDQVAKWIEDRVL